MYFTDCAQSIVDCAYTVKARYVEVANVFMDVECVPFHKGFYSVDMTFFFVVRLDAYTSPTACPIPVCGLATFCKKVILFGSEGCVKIFTNDQNADEECTLKCLPKAKVQVAEPMILSCNIRECPEINLECCCSVPGCVAKRFDGCFENVMPQKIVEVTLGIFSIVQLERDVQMMIPVYDFCIPDKECTTTSDDPCELFKKIKFPVDEFFPPRLDDCNDSDCGCCS